MRRVREGTRAGSSNRPAPGGPWRAGPGTSAATERRFVKRNRFFGSGTYRPTSRWGTSCGTDRSAYLTAADQSWPLARGGGVSLPDLEYPACAEAPAAGPGPEAIRGKKGNA